MQSDVKVEQCDIDTAQAIWHMCDDGPYCTLPSWLTNAFARHRIEASLRQPAPEYGRIHTDGSRSGGQPLTTSTAPDALVERVARAMQAVSRPDVDPDKLTPGPRGSVGLMPVWALYEHMAKAALTAIAPDLTTARIDPATIAGEG